MKLLGTRYPSSRALANGKMRNDASNSGLCHFSCRSGISVQNSRKSKLSQLISSARQHQLKQSEKLTLARPMQLGTSRGAIAENAIRVASTHNHTRQVPPQSDVNDWTVNMRNVSLVSLKICDRQLENKAKGGPKSKFRRGSIDINAILGVKRLTFLRQSSSHSASPSLVVKPLLSSVPGAFSVALQDMFSWPSQRSDFSTPKICRTTRTTTRKPPSKFEILNGTFSF